MKRQKLRIGNILLNWSDWYCWNLLKEDNRIGGVSIPNKQSGVYEAKLIRSKKSLTIGKASDLRMRVRQALIKGKVPHSSGNDIRADEDLDKVIVRWALTSRPAAAEEQLHKLYKKRFHKNPKYTDRT